MRERKYGMRILTFVVVGFVVLCGCLVVESGLFEGPPQAGRGPILLQQTTTINRQQDVDEPAPEPSPQTQELEAAETIALGARNAPARTVILGAADPNTEDPKTGFKFQLELSSKGAAIRKATFSNGNNNGFDDRDHKNPQPLVILSPIPQAGGGEILSMANQAFVVLFEDQEYDPLPMDRLHWKSFDVERGSDGSETARFETTIEVEGTNEPVLKLIKTYKVVPGSYLLVCDIAVENLWAGEARTSFDLAGPGGLGREAFRGDMRNVVGGFMTSDGNIVSSRKDLATSFFGRFTNEVGVKSTSAEYEEALRTGSETRIQEAKKGLRVGRNLSDDYRNAAFLWAATSNKYFTAIVRPVPDEGKTHCEWVKEVTSRFYNPDEDKRAKSGDEAVGLNLEIAAEVLAGKDEPNGVSIREYGFELYLGPKDKELFHENESFRNLRFAQTVTFMPCCCCPGNIIRPLAFGVLTVMKWMYGFIGNYGVVIIILVFLMRLAIHPLTKKSQVSMSKMTKLAPRAEQIKKKYANNKAEMNKQLMALYREQGASPIMGFLPMMVQMPIWIALWSAINASIDLRGAGFLPFWITDLSVPDALYRFSTAITIPLLGWKIESVNLLPLLMGVAFYLQQRLMPSQADASTNPQMAQQQKMMKIMLPLMFPLIVYKAPSGVNLYIMASTFAGVIEQHVIRKHIKQREDTESKGLVAATSKTGGKVKKKKPKPFYKT